tara:strand:+ start:582 stop:995 length:414 start_codon:yes stop_codon:yes gene_type:complete
METDTARAILALEQRIARLEALASVDLETGEIKSPKASRKKEPNVSQEFRQAMADQYEDTLGSYDTVMEHIDLSLAHKAASNYKTWDLYVKGWLRREACRDNRGGKQRQVPVTAGIPEDRNKYRADFESQKQLRMGA